MSTETIREFLAGIGFKVDDASERRFTSAIEGATLRAKLLGDALEATAKAVVDGVSSMATQFEALYYQAQRLGTTGPSIRAFEYAVRQVHGSVEGANAALQSFGEFLRNLPPQAAENLAKQLRIPIEDTRDKAKFLLEIYERLSHMPRYLANQFRETYHLGGWSDFQQLLSNPAGAMAAYNEELKRQSGAGITNEAMKRGGEFEKVWAGVWQRIGDMAAGGESKLLAALVDPMQKFSKWLDDNSPQINDAIGQMATSVAALTSAWVDDLAKVHWTDVATKIDIAAQSVERMTEAIVKDLPAMQALFGAIVGSRIGAPFGPIGAAVGAGAGAIAPSVIESGGIGGWWRSHMPGWLGGGGASSGGQILQNGVPVSDSNPLSVKVAGLSPGGGGVFSNMWNGLFGGGSGGPYGASPGLRLRGNRGVGHWWTPEREAHAVDRLMKEAGLSRVGAAGLVARWAGIEAGGGPTSVNPRSGAQGIGQWLGSRQNADTASGDFDRNLTHAVQELNGSEWRAAYALRNAKTAGDAARGASMYERAEGYSAFTGNDAYTASTPVDAVLKAIAIKTSKAGPAPNWATGHAWDALNAHLPVGPSSVDNSSRSINAPITNNITVNAPDPQSAAAMVGVHLDRTSNDISRNLQGAFQ